MVECRGRRERPLGEATTVTKARAGKRGKRGKGCNGEGGK